MTTFFHCLLRVLSFYGWYPREAGLEVTHQKDAAAWILWFCSVPSKNSKEQDIDDDNCCGKAAYFRGDYLELSLSLPESAPLERWLLWWPLARLAALTSLSSSDPPRREPRLRNRGGIFKLLRSPGIYSKEAIPPAYVAWLAGTTSLFLFSS